MYGPLQIFFQYDNVSRDSLLQYDRNNLPNQEHDERSGNFVEHGHVDIVLAQSWVPPNHGY